MPSLGRLIKIPSRRFLAGRRSKREEGDHGRRRPHRRDTMGSSSRHRARQFVPKHDVQETVENMSHSVQTASPLLESNHVKPMMMTVNAIDAFQKLRQEEESKHQSRTSSDACNSSLSETIPVEEKELEEDIEAACATSGEKLLAPEARASKSASDEETKKKMKETKRRSDKCYGCSFCEYYCSLKECEFCASMLALSRRVDKNMGDIRTKGRTKTSSKHRHQFTCCDIDRLRKRGRESGEDEKVWLVAHGNVYEAHAFLRFHPAGREVMMKGAERDNSEDFDMHSKRAREVWRELRVGELVRCPERGFGQYQSKPGFSVEQCTIM